MSETRVRTTVTMEMELIDAAWLDAATLGEIIANARASSQAAFERLQRTALTSERLQLRLVSIKYPVIEVLK